jgi:hypothetical protein
MNYNPSTIARIADINYGLRVDTAVLPATGWGATAVWPLFTVFNGRVLINQIVGEITTVLSTHATLLKYYFTPTDGAQIDLSAISLTASDLAVGIRILAAGTIGGATTFSGIGASMAQPTPYIVGQVDVGGAIGIESTTATFTSGAAKFSIWYIPLDDGAYVEVA